MTWPGACVWSVSIVCLTFLLWRVGAGIGSTKW
jgi:hypothetical protein